MTVRYQRAEDCPDRATHTESGVEEHDYLGWHAWANRISQTHTQSCCHTCGYWAIWNPKTVRERAEKIIYDLIAEVARELPGSTFSPPGLSLRDSKTRLVVMHNENVQQFVVVDPFQQDQAATAQDIVEHFRRDDL